MRLALGVIEPTLLLAYYATQAKSKKKRKIKEKEKSLNNVLMNYFCKINISQFPHKV